MPFMSRLLGPTAKIKDIQGQAKRLAKDGKDQKIVSQLPWFIDFC